MQTKTDHQALRSSLQQKLDQLQRRIDKIDRDLRQPQEPDSQERAIGRENDEVLERNRTVGVSEIVVVAV